MSCSFYHFHTNKKRPVGIISTPTGQLLPIKSSLQNPAMLSQALSNLSLSDTQFSVLTFHLNQTAKFFCACAEFNTGIRFCISVAQEAGRLNGTFFVPTKIRCLPVIEIHWETELDVLQESAIWLLLLINIHPFYK